MMLGPGEQGSSLEIFFPGIWFSIKSNCVGRVLVET